MRTAKIFPNEQKAQEYIDRKELKTAKIVKYKADRSDPRWTHYLYAVQVTHEEFFDKVYYK